MKIWHAEIVDSNAILQGVPRDLCDALTRVQGEGWTIFTILPNGVNRWTVVAWKDG